MQGEKWAVKAGLALLRAGVDIGNTAGMGWAGLAFAGAKALPMLTYSELEPLMDEMMRCVSFLPNPNDMTVVRPLVATDTQEIITLVDLRDKTWELHTGFSVVESLSKMMRGPDSTSISQSTQTSPQVSEPPSRPVRPPPRNLHRASALKRSTTSLK